MDQTLLEDYVRSLMTPASNDNPRSHNDWRAPAPEAEPTRVDHVTVAAAGSLILNITVHCHGCGCAGSDPPGPGEDGAS